MIPSRERKYKCNDSARQLSASVLKVKSQEQKTKQKTKSLNHEATVLIVNSKERSPLSTRRNTQEHEVDQTKEANPLSNIGAPTMVTMEDQKQRALTAEPQRAQRKGKPSSSPQSNCVESQEQSQRQAL